MGNKKKSRGFQGPKRPCFGDSDGFRELRKVHGFTVDWG